MRKKPASTTPVTEKFHQKPQCTFDDAVKKGQKLLLYELSKVDAKAQINFDTEKRKIKPKG